MILSTRKLEDSVMNLESILSLTAARQDSTRQILERQAVALARSGRHRIVELPPANNARKEPWQCLKGNRPVPIAVWDDTGIRSRPAAVVRSATGVHRRAILRNYRLPAFIRIQAVPLFAARRVHV